MKITSPIRPKRTTRTELPRGRECRPGKEGELSGAKGKEDRSSAFCSGGVFKGESRIFVVRQCSRIDSITGDAEIQTMKESVFFRKKKEKKYPLFKKQENFLLKFVCFTTLGLFLRFLKFVSLSARIVDVLAGDAFGSSEVRTGGSRETR